MDETEFTRWATNNSAQVKWVREVLPTYTPQIGTTNQKNRITKIRLPSNP